MILDASSAILYLHSALRWAALIALVWILVLAVKGMRNNLPYTKTQHSRSLNTMIILHLQLIVGLFLYMVRGWIGVLGQEGTMSNTYTRFFAVEHGFIMILAITLGTLGHILSKRAEDDATKHKRQVVFYGLCLFLILLGIPWPFRPGFEQVGWF